LVVPHKGRHPEFGRNVVNAWKPTRESARAVFDALPLLRNAEKVQIFECKERTGSDDGGAADATIAVRSHAMASNPSCRAPHRNISALASKSNHT
jgi:hypothetical protein